MSEIINIIDSCSLGDTERIIVGITNGENTIWIDTLKYYIKRAPPPEILISGHWRGPIKRESLAQGVVIARQDRPYWEVFARVLQYSVDIYRQDSLIYQETDIQGNKFTTELVSEILKSQQGDKYYFYNVRAILEFEKCERVLQPTYYEIE